MRRINTLVAGLLACLAFTSALPAHFPNGKITQYKYRADVKAGAMVPDVFSSKFSIEAVLKVKQHLDDPDVKNAFNMVLSDVKYGLHNGQDAHYEEVKAVEPIPEAAMMLEEPFIVYYHDGISHGQIKGMRLHKNESGWSMNIKQAIASMMQLDLSSMKMEMPMKPHAFITKEATIHGECEVAYDVHSMDHLGTEKFVVTKVYEPKSCTEFKSHSFDNLENEGCLVEEEDPMSTASRRYFEIAYTGTHMVINKIIGHAIINFFPFQAQTDAHYLLTNQTMELFNSVSMVDMEFPMVDIENSMMIDEIAFKKPLENYAHGAAVDVTQGRHLVQMEPLMAKLKKMLGEAADYLEENHIDMNEPDLKHGETINRMLRTMIYFDLESFEQVFKDIEEGSSAREVTIRNMFLNMVPHVGTDASCFFILNVIGKMKVTDMMAMNMLAMLPFNVRVPTMEMLSHMEGLMKFDDKISKDVRKSSILCFATLVYKTFKDQHELINMANSTLHKYVQDFFEHVQNEPEYEMKMMYMQALQNIEIGVHKILEPVIRGDLKISEKPEYIRFLAMMAAWKPVVNDLSYVHDLYWPILANTKLPLQLRVAAYAILMNQPPHMARMMQIYWLMVYEKNEDLYNFHFTTMQSLAETTNPCMMPMKEMARKLLRFIRARSVPGPLASHDLIDDHNSKYGYTEMMRMMMMYDEKTRMMHMGLMEYSTSMMRKPVNRLGLYWRLEGIDDMSKDLMKTITDTEKVSSEKVEKLLKMIAQKAPMMKNTHVEFSLMTQGRVIFTKYYDMNTLKTLMQGWNFYDIMKSMKTSWQHVMYLYLYEQQVPTDLGVPAVLASRLPSVLSYNMNYDVSVKAPSMLMRLQSDMKVWSHGHYSMNIYNPIVDVWHGVKRVLSMDMSLPMDMSIDINVKSHTLKMTFPRLPVTKHSVSGMMMHTSSYVDVVGDEHGLLHKFCKTCRHFELMSKGEEHRKKMVLMDADSKSTGMKYSMALFDCERDLSPMSLQEYLSNMDLSYRETHFMKELVMEMRRKPLSMMIDPAVGSCGLVMLMEPSVVHPTSHILVSLRGSFENLGLSKKPMHLRSAKKMSLHGVLDAIAADTNNSMRSWDLNFIMDLSDGYMQNNMKVQITRTTPGEKDLKICMEGEKIFPMVDIDQQLPDLQKTSTNGKLTMSMGMSEDGKCGHDASIAVSMKGQFSHEQKSMFSGKNGHQMCMKETQNPYYQTEKMMLPRTVACLEEAIRHTTLREYTFNVAYKKLPQEFMSMAKEMEEMLQFMSVPYETHLAADMHEGNMMLIADFPMMHDSMGLSIITAARQMHYNISIDNADGMMDNVYFSKELLQSIKLGNTKFCSVYPEMMMNADNWTMPFVVSDQWTLLSGDHASCSFAVFVKNSGSRRMAMKAFMINHILEVIPTADKTVVTVDGQVIDNIEDGMLVPGQNEADYAMRITMNNGHMMVQSERIPMEIEWTMNTVTLFMDRSLQGKVSGICGHMDGMYKKSAAPVITISEM